ncbi:AAA family ATPase, partial [Candidatus Giovannonibacteria bacterium]|nr:AAA family ATPase [Candidatus Giovannonibacteria bacterium]
MRLKRLELSGFKSFAKQTILEFPHPVSAVVGPNGSGKSNVADAIRWVLGEQSIKSLRGKRGEDLIFAGSVSAPRLSKASALLVFDNSAREFPLEFEEVSIGRRVYRDGLNDYLLNGSQVRLKDIIELLARVGFGSSQHHIIGQGEADRILYASPRERREMIEDALGLKIFQIKRLEAERKLEHTEENMRQVSSLQKEIQPHLKFLKGQAEKYEVASKIRQELKGFLEEYLSRKLATVTANLKALSEKRAGPQSALGKIEREIRTARARIEKADRPEAQANTQDRALEEKLQQTREREMRTLRELGRLEGMIALEEKGSKETGESAISKSEMESVLNSILGRLEAMADESV